MAAPASLCPRCSSAVAVLDGRPIVSARGIELWHPTCWEVRDTPFVVEAPPPLEEAVRSRSRSPRRAPKWIAAGLVASSIVGVWVLRLAWADLPAALPDVVITTQEPLGIRGAMMACEDPPPRIASFMKELQNAYEVPVIEGVPLDETFPSLKDWIHPVTASAEYMPESPPRLFGAERAGVERPECGYGHCGIDLDGPRGRPIVAVAAGSLVRVERSELGADRRSGRYVRIQHDDGTLTSYMHMDDVAEGLDVGDRVQRGQYIGTLGATAVYESVPHLHFSLEIPSSYAKRFRGDHVGTYYVNPAPFLMKSKIVPVVERSEKKPAI